jgi:hypothetical protein
MREVYKDEGRFFTNSLENPRYQVENLPRLRRDWVRESRRAYFRGQDPERIEGQEEARVNWEGFKVLDWS